MSEPPPPSPDFDALLAALAEKARSSAGSEASPEPEELLDYLAGSLAPEDEQRVARQLAADPEASRALLDLADLEAAGAAAAVAKGRPADLAARAGWRDFQAKLPDATPRPHRPRPPAWLSGIAAALLVATVSLGSWVWQLKQEGGRPIANVQSLDLISGSRAGDEPVRELASGTPLRLVLDPAERCPGYTVELEGPRPGDRQTIGGVERDGGGQLTVLLPAPGPGPYRLLLTGCAPRHALEEHRFRITRP
ncbi:MAG TPA: hypothetical protein VEW48_10085 [Thermoanaerobaculia bacterium]|nr:hypothetical protein [Thermoanaerobaculia bacterium]